jgi:hypothetical protein
MERGGSHVGEGRGGSRIDTLIYKKNIIFIIIKIYWSFVFNCYIQSKTR